MGTQPCLLLVTNFFDPFYTMDAITVAKSAVIINAAMVVMSVTFHIGIAVVTVALMKNGQTSKTWSVFSRLLQQPFWSFLLANDTGTSKMVKKSISWATRFATLTGVLITLAGIITPLGLYNTSSGIVQMMKLNAVNDVGLLSRAIMNRVSYVEARICADGISIFSYACPGTSVYTTANGTMTQSTRVPRNITAKFSSNSYYSYGTGAMDMQFRMFDWGVMPQFNDGGKFVLGQFAFEQTTIASTGLFASANLIIDRSETPGIGIMNVKVPFLENGGNWSRNAFWIEPVTECVDLNVTYDYVLSDASPDTITPLLSGQTITDRGGFTNFNLNNYQPNQPIDRNLNLQAHAYQAANYALRTGIVSFNISAPQVGKSYPIMSDLPLPVGLEMGLQMLDVFSSLALNFNSSVGAESNDSFVICGAYASQTEPNLDTASIACGLLFGKAIRTDGGPSNIAVTNSTWSQPIYACASATRAKIQKINFSTNVAVNKNTQLSSINITRQDFDQPVVWAVERTGMKALNVQPYWGPVSDVYLDNEYLYTTTAPFMYAPKSQAFLYGQAIAMPTYAWSVAFGTVAVTDIGGMNYFDSSKPILNKLWSDHATVDTVPYILNSIWTDIMANGIVGVDVTSEVVVTVVQPKVGFHLIYGIPVLVAAILWVPLLISGIGVLFINRGGISTTRKVLEQTALGRVVEGILSDGNGNNNDTAYIGLVQTTSANANSHIQFGYLTKEDPLYKVLCNSAVSESIEMDSVPHYDQDVLLGQPQKP